MTTLKPPVGSDTVLKYFAKSHVVPVPCGIAVHPEIFHLDTNGSSVDLLSKITALGLNAEGALSRWKQQNKKGDAWIGALQLKVGTITSAKHVVNKTPIGGLDTDPHCDVLPRSGITDDEKKKFHQMMHRKAQIAFVKYTR